MSDISATNLAVDIGMGYMAVTSLTAADSSNTTKLLVAAGGAYGGHMLYKSFVDDVPGAITHPWQSIKDVFSGKGSLGEDLVVGAGGYGAYKGGSAAYKYLQGGQASAEEAAEVGAETTAEATEIATTATEVATTATESVSVGAEVLGGLETVGEFLPFLLI